MSLPHNALQTSLSGKDAVRQLNEDGAKEIDLAYSKAFTEETILEPSHFDYGEVEEAYRAFFDSKRIEIETELGRPAYSGRSDGFPSYIEIIPDEIPPPNEIVVWNGADGAIYLRWNWDDAECPIEICMGIAGCSPSRFDAWAIK